MLDAGTFKMRPGILELIAGIALSEVEGASGTGVRSDHPENLKRRKNLSRGIKADVDEGRVVLELDVNLDYGKDFHEVAGVIQRGVTGAVEAMTGWSVDAVNVNVVGVNAL
jgi:uncharacterized alkaline shock family protein YloU